MNLQYSPYELMPSGNLNARSLGISKKGALIRLTKSDGSIGYSLIQPWTEYHDEGVDIHLASWSNASTKLMQAALVLANRDAVARKAGVGLIDPDFTLTNNFLITDVDQLSKDWITEIKKFKYLSLKIKCGRDIEKEKYFVKKAIDSQNFLVRVDFNSTLSWDQFEFFFEGLKKTAIEYAEDPFAYNFAKWAEGRKIIKLAADFESERWDWNVDVIPACDSVVIKPARHNISQVEICLKEWQMPFTITSSMDHAVGVAHAISVAQEWKRRYPNQALSPGCDTLGSFLPDKYSSQITRQGPILKFHAAPGVGFQKLLESEPWQTVS